MAGIKIPMYNCPRCGTLLVGTNVAHPCLPGGKGNIRITTFANLQRKREVATYGQSYYQANPSAPKLPISMTPENFQLKLPDPTEKFAPQMGFSYSINDDTIRGFDGHVIETEPGTPQGANELTPKRIEPADGTASMDFGGLNEV